MPPDPSPALPAEAQTVAAPRRERRLLPGVRQAARPAPTPFPVPASPGAERLAKAAPPPSAGSRVELKLATLHDPEEILKAVLTEAALRRADRLSSRHEEQRHALRLLSVVMLFALLAAAVGAMWYLQTTLEGGRQRPRPHAAAPGTSPAAFPAPKAR